MAVADMLNGQVVLLVYQVVLSVVVGRTVLVGNIVDGENVEVVVSLAANNKNKIRKIQYSFSHIQYIVPKAPHAQKKIRHIPHAFLNLSKAAGPPAVAQFCSRHVAKD